MSSGFDFHLATRIIFGAGSLERLGELAAEAGGHRVLLVSDPGIVAAGHTDAGLASLAEAGLEATVFSGVEENPTTAHVRSGVAVAKEFGADLIVGLGGGSSMDCAKGINFLVSCGGEMKDYWGVGKATGPLLPMVAIPTTAGTGSETQSFALIADEHTHQKMACGDKRAACFAAILDPLVTVSQPRVVTAATGIDAISHAVETYVTNKRNTLSESLSMQAWIRLSANFERVLNDPGDVDARAQMQLGAALAGMAIENSMLGAAHSAANPLTAHFGVVHGGAVGVMLPHIVRFNAAVVGDRYEELACADPKGQNVASVSALATRLQSLLNTSELGSNLREHRVDLAKLPELAEQAAQQWTAQFNPRPVSKDDFLKLYSDAYAATE